MCAALQTKTGSPVLPPPEERFCGVIQGLTALIAELLQISQKKGCDIVNPILIRIASDGMKKYSPTQMIENFILYSCDYWGQIHKEDENFFGENSSKIFGELPLAGEYISKFKLLFTAKDAKNEHIIVAEDRKSLWTFFKTLVKICLAYIHEKRIPYKGIDLQGNPVASYRDPTIFSQVDIFTQATLFGVKLSFK